MSFLISKRISNYHPQKPVAHSQIRNYSSSISNTPRKFDPEILKYIACPLTKTKLRYDEANQELICDELGLIMKR
jgi:hypothetical protein